MKAGELSSSARNNWCVRTIWTCIIGRRRLLSSWGSFYNCSVFSKKRLRGVTVNVLKTCSWSTKHAAMYVRFIQLIWAQLGSVPGVPGVPYHQLARSVPSYVVVPRVQLPFTALVHWDPHGRAGASDETRLPTGYCTWLQGTKHGPRLRVFTGEGSFPTHPPAAVLDELSS